MNLSTESIKKIEQSLGLEFKDKNILEQALTHRSYLNEARTPGRTGKSLQSNERMEFLGDSILSFWVSANIFTKFPGFPEGKLTFIRTYLVKTETLTSLSRKLSLGDFMLMSKGEETGAGRTNPALLANCFEAVLGAIFIDQGIEVASKFLAGQFDPLIEKITDIEAFRDSKSLLQEQIQAKGYSSPVYREISAFGPDHQKSFTMGVYVNDKLLAEGTSHSKQEAEELAAQRALNEHLLENLPKIK